MSIIQEIKAIPMFFIFISFLLEFPGLEYFFLRRSRATPSFLNELGNAYFFLSV